MAVVAKLTREVFDFLRSLVSKAPKAIFRLASLVAMLDDLFGSRLSL